MAALTIYCHQNSNRLQYILDWLFPEVFQLNYEISHDPEFLKPHCFVVKYGDEGLSFPDSGLLWEHGIAAKEIATGVWKSLPVLFFDENTKADIPFDLLSACFFLLSRYEEYCPYIPDKHGRYPPEESILYKKEILRKPVVDYWIYAFYVSLKEIQVPVKLKEFSYTPTYDLDMVFSFKYKGFWRNLGGFLKSFTALDFKTIRRRKNVLLNKTADPFDAFEFLKSLHLKKAYNPIFFVLASLKTTAFDKNISPKQQEMKLLIQAIHQYAAIGLHPSYFSYHPEIFTEEKKILEKITGADIKKSRQHYIKMKLPDTYRYLLKQKITADYSMGYGSKLGFRAGTGRSFLWYDLGKEALTDLRVYPFCFMDSTAMYEENLPVAAAFRILKKMTQELQHTHSDLITVFHNFSLGTDDTWKGWKEQYALFYENLTEVN